MGELFKNCYACGKTCINGQFSLDGDSPNSDISLPRTLKVKVIANPAYWGFGGGNDDNVLVSGYAYFSNGHYDFFYGYNEDHIGCRVCGRYQDEICSKNDQRPDVGYRTVLSETGTRINYNYNTNDGVTRGGAEVFLIDRSATQFSDNANCESTDPETIFKKNPDNYGFGNKILFKDAIYKNITGAWRLAECSECYSSGGYNLAKNCVCNQGSSSYLEEARQENNDFIFLEDGYDTRNSKQNIRVDENFGQYYDPAKKYCTSHSSLENCIQDGSYPINYGGQLISLTRNESTNNFIQAKIKYLNDPAYAIKNGDYIAIETSGNTYDGGYYVMDVFHNSGHSFVSLFGTYDFENHIYYIDPAAYSPIITYGFNNGNIIIYGFLNDDIVNVGTWQVYNTIDPNGCCGGAAYGVNNETKQYSNEPPYHVDIKKVFNNSKNELYSNREKFISGKPRKDYRFIATSGGIPILDSIGDISYVGEFPYYGPHYEADIEDTFLRTSNDKKTTYQNGTCYTKSQELMIFPDSLTQSYEYIDCTEGTKHRQNIVPRLTFVYKPCNYNDNCSFNSSGQPMTAGASGMPSTLEDLKRGFGGQEIVMHVNIGAAWGNKIRLPEPCACEDPVPPGEIPFDPEVVVPSPITFPCLPKFDLRPEDYGCLDPMWYNTVRNALGISYQGQCEEPFYDACFIKQPYPTYGYIRNLCGAEQNSRLDVLKSLSNRQPNGQYRDITPESGSIVEPMYVNFLRPLDDTGLGFPTAGLGEYADVLPPSTGVDDEDGDGIPDMSGIRVNKPYWGLADNQGRLSFPYFYTKISYGQHPSCPPDEPVIYTYVNIDRNKTRIDGFPTDEVPFLIELDHEDYCVGCAANQIEDKQYYITLESLPAKYLHGTATVDANGLDEKEDYSFKYGFNYCKYPGNYAIPDWRIDASGNEAWFVPTGCNNTYVELTSEYTDANPHTGETCGCLNYGITVPLKLHVLAGTNVPKYYSTDGGINSYTPFPTGCSEPRDNGGADPIMEDYTVYFAAFLHCSYLSNIAPSIEEGTSNVRSYGNLSALYNCGDCSHSYPATNSKPNLSLDFWYVRKGWESWFESYTDTDLTNGAIVDFLELGAGFGFVGPYGDSYTGPISIGSLGAGACGSGYKDVMGMCVPYDAGVLSSCNLGNYPEWEAAASYGTVSPSCLGYRTGDRIIKLGTTVPGCEGSSITLYGYSYFNTQSSSLGTDGGFNRGFPHVRSSPGTASGCCEVGCYLGEDPGYHPEYYSSIPAFLYADSLSGCTSCGDYKMGCLGQCGGLDAALSCYGRTDETCCRNNSSLFGPNGESINRPMWVNHCFANGQESADVIGTFYWLPASGSCDAGYYGSVNASHAEIFFRIGSEARGIDSSNITAWDGTNIPGIGNVTKAPVNEPLARRASQMSNVGVSTCNFDSGPNKSTHVFSEFSRVKRLYESFGYDHTYTHIGPVECTKNLAGSIVPGTCVRPIYPNTMADIAAGGSGLTSVEVIKETFYPEIMTVHRVECSGNGYALHVSREYYEHDHKAYATRKYVLPGPPPTFVIDKFPIYGKIDGGREGVLYENPAGADNANHYFSVCNTGNLDTYPNNILGVYDYPIIIPMIARSDFGSPCYDDNYGSCLTANEPFNKSYCTPYYDLDSYEGGNGAGASGYFSTDSSGSLSFIITNSGSDYYYPDASGSFTACARAIFDNPCVGLSLFIETGQFSTYGVSGYAIDYDACGTGIIFPTGSTWPVTIVPCDAEPSYICANITTQVCSSPPDTGEIYPNFYNNGSGTPLWNYYNLTYDLGNPNGYFLSDAALIGASFYPTAIPGERAEPFPVNEQTVTDSDINPGFVNGTLITNQDPLGTDSTNFTCSYSCIREEASGCGGEFFTNKEFLPRRNYAIGTKVTRYGPLSICAQTAEQGWGNWLNGHVDLSSSIIDTMELGEMDDVRYLNFVDPSRSGAYTTLTSPVDLNDDVIYVEELTTLLGAKHPFFKMLEPQSLDNKSCIMPDSGCFHFLPTHNNSTAFGMEQENFFSGEDVYYTNKEIIREAIANGLVGTSGCLLEPFKIMVDVEPCGERLGHIGTSDPMNLSWVVPNVTAGICRGWLRSVANSCGSTCDNKIEAVGLNAFFGCTEVAQYTCVEYDDSNEPTGNTFCSWDGAPDCSGCYGVDKRQRFIFTGLDGVVYLSPVIGTLIHLNNDLSIVEGKFINASCKEGAGRFPGGLVSGHGHDCSLIGDFTYTDTCSELDTTFEHFQLRKYVDDKYAYDDIFCTFLKNSTNFDDYKAGGVNGCGGGQIKGYRNMNVIETGNPSAYCGLLRQIHEEYECYNPSTIQECPYPSVLKVTITE